MLQELITLDLRITVPEPATPTNTPVAADHVGVFNREIASLGYTFGPDVLARLAALDAVLFATFRARVLTVLEAIAGAGENHSTLFRRFPYDTPDDRAYFASRIIGFLQNILDVSIDDCEILDCGHVIDTRLFDLDAFGACPLCQGQVGRLAYTPIRPNVPAKPFTPLKVLHLADEAWLSERGSALLARQSSLSEAEKALLSVLAGRVPLRLPETVFKETLPFVYRLLGCEAVQPHLSGATDVLRIAAFVSAADADLSLAKAPRLHLSTSERQDMLALLEGLDDIAEDLLRHVGLWKRFARHVHIGQARYRARYPKTVAAFERVRHDPKGIATYDRVAERSLRAGTVDARLLDVLARRPGSFLRRFDQILRTAGDGEAVLATLARVAPEATPRLLLTLKKHLEYREEPRRLRVFMPKGNTNLVQIAEDRRAPIDPALLHEARQILARALNDHFAKQPSLGTVYLDPDLTEIVLPYNRRGDSATSLPVGKGSRFALAAGTEVVRLFVHWTGRDVDLSLIALDEDLRFIEQISFTNLSGQGLAHSGDVQNAPHGASEFIDVALATMHARGIRYLCTSVISYSGEPFDTFSCFAGFMERDGLKTGAVYDPATVRLKFAVRGTSRSYAPLVLDLAERKVIWVDFATRGGRHQAVYAQSDKFRALAQAALDLPRIKPTAYDVLASYASARGRIVFRPDQAETVYRADTVDAERIAALLD